MAQGEELLEQRVVLRPPDGEEGDRHVAAYAGVVGVHSRRHRVGVVGRDRDQPVVVGRVCLEPVGGQTGEPLGGHPDGAGVVADVLGELLVDLGHPLLDRGDPGADLLVLVDAGPGEVLEDLVEEPPGLLVETSPLRWLSVEGGEHLVEVAVEAELGDQPVHVLLGLLGGVTDRLVGMHVAEQRAHRGRVAQVAADLVVLLQRGQGVTRRIGLQLVDQLAGARDAIGGAGGDPLLGVLDVGQGQRSRRHSTKTATQLTPGNAGSSRLLTLSYGVTSCDDRALPGQPASWPRRRVRNACSAGLSLAAIAAS